MKKIIWNIEDIDAAYLMGVINATIHKIDINDPIPSITVISKEIDRLKSLGFKRPYEAVIELRKKQLEDDPTIKNPCKLCGKELTIREEPEKFCMDPYCDEYCKLQ